MAFFFFKCNMFTEPVAIGSNCVRRGAFADAARFPRWVLSAPRQCHGYVLDRGEYRGHASCASTTTTASINWRLPAMTQSFRIACAALMFCVQFTIHVHPKTA